MKTKSYHYSRISNTNNQSTIRSTRHFKLVSQKKKKENSQQQTNVCQSKSEFKELLQSGRQTFECFSYLEERKKASVTNIFIPMPDLHACLGVCINVHP